MMVRIHKLKTVYSLSYRYNTFITDEIKNLPKRRFNDKTKEWEVNIENLFIFLTFCKNNKIDFYFSNTTVEDVKQHLIQERNKYVDLEKKNVEYLEFKKTVEDNYLEYKESVESKLKNVDLYPFQIASVAYLTKISSGLLSLQPGLGKTITSIAYALYNNFNKILVVTPNSLKYNFLNEINKFTDCKAKILDKKDTKLTLKDKQFIIVNYEYFNSSSFNKKLKVTNLGLGKIDCVIFDESHKIKNPKSNTLKNIKKCYSKVKSKLFLSGTPAPNHFSDIYTVLNLINKLDFDNLNKFKKEFCGLEFQKSIGWVMVKPPDLDELYRRLSPYIFRKKKEEVLKDLPSKTLQQVVFELTPNEYQEYENTIKNELNGNESLLMIQSVLSKFKINATIDLIDSLVQANEKVVVVDFYKESLNILHEKYSEVSVLHTGDMEIDERNESVQRFKQDEKIKIFFGSEAVTKEGHTLTEASYMIIITPSVIPGVNEQTQDRLHRIGAKGNVTILYPLAKNTIDETIFYVQISKQKQINKVIDGTYNIDSYNIDLKDYIISELKNKYNDKGN